VANVLGRQSLSGIQIIEVDDDPSLSSGTVAPIGTIASAPSLGRTWVKTAAGDTAWVTSSALPFKSHSGFAGSDRYQKTGAILTSNATPTTLVSVTGIADDTAYMFEADVIAAGSVAATTEFACYKIIASAYKATGFGVTIENEATPYNFESAGGGGLAVNFDVSGSTTVILEVTGIASEDFNWTCTLRWQAVPQAPPV